MATAIHTAWVWAGHDFQAAFACVGLRVEGCGVLLIAASRLFAGLSAGHAYMASSPLHLGPSPPHPPTGLKLFGEDDEYGKIADEISAISGVVGHGLVVGRAAAVVMARPGQQQPDVVEF